MCGVTGWVDLDRDLGTERDTLDAMTATMACRGPDAGGVVIDGNAALGHRRLAVIDLPGGAQPMLTGDGDGTVLTYSGEVYNFAELRSELTTRGHRFRTRSDTEVVLRGYLEWGDDLPSRLVGMYAFAVWDPRRRRLVLVRDRLGVKPLYYAPVGDGLVFGSEPKAILAHPQVRPVLGRDGLRELMTWANTPGHALFDGIRQVRPGHQLVLDDTGITETRYWGLDAVPHPDGLSTTIDTVRQLVGQAVAGQTVADLPLCSLLSGGLDSSTVTLLAAQAVDRRGDGPLRSFSVGFTGGDTDGDDSSYAAKLAAAVGADHEEIVLGADQLFDADARAAVLRARDLPLGLADMDTSLYLLFGAIRKRSTVALSGEGADELFGGYPWFHDEGAVHADTFPWMHGFAGAAPAGPSFLDPELPRRLALDEYRADRYADAVAQVPVLDGESPVDRRMRRVCHLFLTRFLPMLLERKDRMSMAVGLEVRVPFCDHRLVDYVVNVPWAMKSFDGQEKSLLRAAMTGALPDFVLTRRKSPYPTVSDPAYDRRLREKLAELMADDEAPVRPLMDPTSARQAFAAVRAAGPAELRFLRVGFESLLRINDWMRGYGVTLAL